MESHQKLLFPVAFLIAGKEIPKKSKKNDEWCKKEAAGFLILYSERIDKGITKILYGRSDRKHGRHDYGNRTVRAE